MIIIESKMPEYFIGTESVSSGVSVGASGNDLLDRTSDTVLQNKSLGGFPNLSPVHRILVHDTAKERLFNVHAKISRRIL